MEFCLLLRARDDGKVCYAGCIGAGDEANPGLVGGKDWGRVPNSGQLCHTVPFSGTVTLV